MLGHLVILSLLASTQNRNLADVMEWNVSGNRQISNVLTSSVSQGMMSTFESLQVTATFSGSLKQTLVDDENVEWEGTGTMTVSNSSVKRQVGRFPGGASSLDYRTDDGGGTTKVRIFLEVDQAEKRYQFSVSPLDEAARYPAKTHEEKVMTGSPAKVVDLQSKGTFSEIGASGLRLQPSGLVIADQSNKTKNEKSGIPGIDGGESKSDKINWIFTPGNIIDHELKIKPPTNFNEWLPDPYSDSGAIVEIPIKLQKTGGGATNRKLKTIKVRLTGTSLEPGECLNTKGAKEVPDVKIFRTVPDADLGEDAQTAEIPMGDSDEQTAKVYLKVSDAAAWTRMSAYGEFTDRRVVVGRVEGTNELELSVPIDADLNKIGDAWERKMDSLGIAPHLDADSQNGNSKNGDGLGAFEEYRGIKIDGKLSRFMKTAGGEFVFHPKKKDLVVNNQGGPSLRPGFVKFEKHAGIGVFEIHDGVLPGTRQINEHSQTGHGGNQYSVTISVNENPDQAFADAIGATTGAGQQTNMIPHPEKCDSIFVAPGKIASFVGKQAAVMVKNGYDMPYTASELVAETVAHELAHSIGVLHHGAQESDGDIGLMKTVAEDRSRLRTTNGAENAALFDLISENIGGKDSVASGDVHCFMCYRDFYNWAHTRWNDKHYYFKIMPIELGNGFCKSPAGTGWNAAGGSLPSFFGNAASERGNCLGQMLVKDW